jgi:hypothetical protein
VTGRGRKCKRQGLQSDRQGEIRGVVASLLPLQMSFHFINVFSRGVREMNEKTFP